MGMDEIAELEAEAQDLRAKIYALKRSNTRMREALTFYANPQIYKPHPHGPAFDRRGDLAAVAIEALRGATP